MSAGERHSRDASVGVVFWWLFEGHCEEGSKEERLGQNESTSFITAFL